MDVFLALVVVAGLGGARRQAFPAHHRSRRSTAAPWPLTSLAALCCNAGWVRRARLTCMPSGDGNAFAVTCTVAPAPTATPLPRPRRPSPRRPHLPTYPSSAHGDTGHGHG